MRVAQPPHRSSSSFFFSRWRDGIGRASMVSAVDAPRCGESTSSPGARGTKHSDGVQSGCTPWMAALFSGPPLILVGRQLRPLSSSARATCDVPFILQLGSSSCIGMERCHSLDAGPSGGLSPTRPQHPHWHLRAYSTSIIPSVLSVDASAPWTSGTFRGTALCCSSDGLRRLLPCMGLLLLRAASAALRPSGSSLCPSGLSSRLGWLPLLSFRASLLSEVAPTARSPAQW